ncbi:MAG TPA: hypothetical protein VF635_16965, partial [Propionibacteriaceae bacterium]
RQLDVGRTAPDGPDRAHGPILLRDTITDHRGRPPNNPQPPASVPYAALLLRLCPLGFRGRRLR